MEVATGGGGDVDCDKQYIYREREEAADLIAIAGVLGDEIEGLETVVGDINLDKV